MKEVGLQIYTVRDFTKTPEALAETMKKIREIGYTSIQTAGSPKTVEEAKAYKAAADAAGLSICGTHISWQLICEDIDTVIEIHKILDTTNVGVGAMPVESRGSKEDLIAFIETANKVAERLAKEGMKFTYHNHSFEFKKYDGITMMDSLIEGFDPRITFVLDVYWLQHGGCDIRKMMERLAGRVDILHLKDMAACGGEKGNVPYITEIGNGNINFEDIIPLGDKIGVKHFVVEQDLNFSTGNSMESIKTSYEYLKANFMN